MIVDTQVIAAATNCMIHIAASLESNATKDDAGEWDSQTMVGKSWDGSTDALVVIDESETGLTTFDAVGLIGTECEIEFSTVKGTQNRVKDSYFLKGTAIINDLTVNAPKSGKANYSLKFQGSGELVRGLLPPTP